MNILSLLNKKSLRLKKNIYTNLIKDKNIETDCLNLITSILQGIDIYTYNSSNIKKFYFSEIIEKKKLLNLINKSKSNIFLKTSGTTGKPKIIKKKIKDLLKDVKINKKYSEKNWGFCYSSKHISGLSVIFQCLLNNSNIYDLRNISKKKLVKNLNAKKINFISATPTFYRMNLPIKVKNFISTVTIGGEESDRELIEKIKKSFPKKKIVNIYASTENGFILKSNSYLFSLSKNKNIKILSKQIYFKKNNKTWINTKDLVKFHSKDLFEIIGRDSDFDNIMGYLVSFKKIEKKFLKIKNIKDCKVYTLPHKYFGKILSADISCHKKVNLENIRNNLKMKLRNYEIPVKINIVSNMQLTYSGKKYK